MSDEYTFMINPDHPSGPAVLSPGGIGTWGGTNSKTQMNHFLDCFDQDGYNPMAYAERLQNDHVILDQEAIKDLLTFADGTKTVDFEEKWDTLEGNFMVSERTVEFAPHILPHVMENVNERIYRDVRKTLAEVDDDIYRHLVEDRNLTLLDSTDGCERILQLASDVALPERYQERWSHKMTIGDVRSMARETLANEVELYTKNVLEGDKVPADESPGQYIEQPSGRSTVDSETNQSTPKP